jgi:glycosyltransferase involved in cell wall biosynthesis
VRILIFHGYLLGGTGSNVYNARLASALVDLGHEVHLISQDRHPEDQPFVDEYGIWEDGSLRVRPVGGRIHGGDQGDRAGDRAGDRGDRLGARDGGRCTVYRPDIGLVLPVYVPDRYEGIDARTFADCTDEEVAGYIDANVSAVREVVARARPEIALANHLVMGPVILARALAGDGGGPVPGHGRGPGGVPYAVKVHGSALEYTVKADPDRFLPYAREGLAGARGILVGSRHTAESLWKALEDPTLVGRTRLGPPGVDVERFTPRDPVEAREGVRTLVSELGEGASRKGVPARARGCPRGASHSEGSDRGDGLVEEGLAEEGLAEEGLAEDGFARDDSAAARTLERLDLDRDRLVAFVGKLIVSKGVDLLITAWPLVLEREPDARLVVVGFGGYRHGLEGLLDTLSAGDLPRAREVALAARPRLRYLLAFLDGLEGLEEPEEPEGAAGRARYLEAARGLSERVLLTGRLDHEELTELLPACESVVVPSTFPEAFGMVAVEAAACGALPIGADHSGLAEVAHALALAVPESVVPLLSFPVDDHAVRALAARIVAWLGVDRGLRSRTRAGLVATVRERWSWEGVARGVIDAAQGELEGLARP